MSHKVTTTRSKMQFLESKKQDSLAASILQITVPRTQIVQCAEQHLSLSPSFPNQF